HLRFDSGRLLRGPIRPNWLVSPAFCGGKFFGACIDRPFIRYSWPPDDDRFYLYCLRLAVGFNRLAFPAQFNRRHDADCLLDDNLFLRVMRGKLGLTTSDRTLSGRRACSGTSCRLRWADRRRGCRSCASVQKPNGGSPASKRVPRLAVGARADAPWRASGRAVAPPRGTENSRRGPS